MAAKREPVEAAQVDAVYVAWLALKPEESRHRYRYTGDRYELIAARLRLGYSADDLSTMIRFAHLSSDRWARWMQGHNPRNKAYLDLENLLVRKKLAERVERALAWMEAGSPRDGQAGVTLGTLGQYR